tara:strand:- start:542 stop:967 length:426 start_codon:yes stop_codon:yes gene_type:complete
MKKECKSLGMSDDRFNELMQEIAETERIDNSNTDMIDITETKKEIQKAIGKFDVDIVYDKLNSTATIFENTAEKLREHEIEERNYYNGTEGDSRNLYKSSERYFAGAAEGYESAAKDLREAITSIIRDQKQVNRIIKMMQS